MRIADTGKGLKRTCVGRFLYGVIAAWTSSGIEEGVVGKTVEQRGLFHDLEDRVLDWRRIRSRQRVEVQ